MYPINIRSVSVSEEKYGYGYGFSTIRSVSDPFAPLFIGGEGVFIKGNEMDSDQTVRCLGSFTCSKSGEAKRERKRTDIVRRWRSCVFCWNLLLLNRSVRNTVQRWATRWSPSSFLFLPFHALFLKQILVVELFYLSHITHYTFYFSVFLIKISSSTLIIRFWYLNILIDKDQLNN